MYFCTCMYMSMFPLSCARARACTTFRPARTAFTYWPMLSIGHECHCPRGRPVRARRNKIRGNIGICMYVCVCTYVYVCICIHACMYVCMYVCIYVCMYCICMYCICMYVCTHLNFGGWVVWHLRGKIVLVQGEIFHLWICPGGESVRRGGTVLHSISTLFCQCTCCSLVV